MAAWAVAAAAAACAPAGALAGQLQVIGAGLQRSSLQSLTAALWQLGFIPAGGFDYQLNPEGYRPWKSWLFGGGPFEPAAAFLERGPWNATTDFPFNLAYMELMERYPKAKVILSVRDTPEVWVRSYVRHIPEYDVLKHYGAYAYLLSHGFTLEEAEPSSRIDEMKRATGCDVRALQQAAAEADAGRRRALFRQCEQIYQDHVDAVIRQVPKDRLLVFNAKQGWGPLCDFLGVPQPAWPFPRVDNVEAEYAWWCYSFPFLAFLVCCFVSMVFFLRRWRRGRPPAGAPDAGKKRA